MNFGDLVQLITVWLPTSTCLEPRAIGTRRSCPGDLVDAVSHSDPLMDGVGLLAAHS